MMDRQRNGQGFHNGQFAVQNAHYMPQSAQHQQHNIPNQMPSNNAHIYQPRQMHVPAQNQNYQNGYYENSYRHQQGRYNHPQAPPQAHAQYVYANQVTSAYPAGHPGQLLNQVPLHLQQQQLHQVSPVPPQLMQQLSHQQHQVMVGQHMPPQGHHCQPTHHNKNPYQNHGHGDSKYDSRTSSNLSPTAQEFVPSGFMMKSNNFNTMQQQNQHLDHEESSLEDSSCDEAILQLQMFITDVTLSPALYENKLKDLTELLQEELRENAISQVVPVFVSNIFQAGILQQNFRYSGARLCAHLSTHLKIRDKYAFRDELLQQAHKEVTSVPEITGDNAKDRKHRGLALFMADILSQLDVGFSLEVNTLYPNFGSAVVKLITNLLKSNEKENQKNSIQALKLCGASLEKMCCDSSEMEDLMNDCKKIEDSDNVDSTIKFMLSRLPDLRSSNWGYAPRAVDQYPSSASQSEGVANEAPVYYGPDGVPLSQEEIGFLQGDAGSSDGYSSSCAGSGVPGMDDDAYDAYEQFLSETGQK